MKSEEKKISKEEIRKFVNENKSKLLKEAKEIETAIRSNKAKQSI